MDVKANSNQLSSVILHDWHTTPEGEDFFKKFLNSSATGRRLYGVLERPAVFDGIEEVTYKLLFVGKSGIGKTFAIAHLAGLFGHTSYSDTIGIEVTDIYWPVKIWDKVILFKLQCWDAGEGSLKKYNHVLESCQDKVDLRVYLFAYNDTSSFADVPGLISSYSSKDTNQVASIVLGTRSGEKTNISPSEIKNFKLTYGIGVYSLPQSNEGNPTENLQDLVSLLNRICEILWLRDQHYIMNNSVTV